MTDDQDVTDRLADHRRSLFLAAGVLMGVTAVLFTGEVVTGSELGTLLGIAAPLGFSAAFLGTLGLAPTLRDRSPGLTRLGMAALAVGVVGGAILVLGHLAELVGLLAGQVAVVDAANLLLLAGVIVGFGSVGVAGVRTGVTPGVVAWLLLWPAVVFGLLIVVVATFALGLTLPHTIHVGHSASEAVVYLVIGHQLGGATGHAERSSTAADAAG